MRGTEAVRTLALPALVTLAWSSDLFVLARAALEGASALPRQADITARPTMSEKCHMRKWHRSRNGIVRPVNGSTKRPVNGSTKPCMRENPLRWRSHFEFRRSFLARGG
jgi:hypothetical protein